MLILILNGWYVLQMAERALHSLNLATIKDVNSLIIEVNLRVNLFYVYYS